MKKIIGIVGKSSYGKNTVGEYLQRKYNIPLYGISDELKIIAKEKNIEPTIKNLINISCEIAKSKGYGYIIDRIIKKESSDIISIHGIRQSGMINYLKNNTQLYLLSVNTNPKIAFERLVERQREGDAKNFKEYEVLSQDNNKSPQDEDTCINLAQYEIENNGTVEELYIQIDNFIKNIFN